MDRSKKLSSLIKDTILYLKNEEIKFYESNDNSFVEEYIKNEKNLKNQISFKTIKKNIASPDKSNDTKKPESINLELNKEILIKDFEKAEGEKSLSFLDKSKIQKYKFLKPLDILHEKEVSKNIADDHPIQLNDKPKNLISRETTDNENETNDTIKDPLLAIDDQKITADNDKKNKSYEVVLEKEKNKIKQQNNTFEKRVETSIPNEFSNNKTSLKEDFQILNNNQTGIENKKIVKDVKPQIIDDNFSDIKNILKKIKNEIIINDVLDDKIAKQKAQKYILKNIASPITIFAYKENEEIYKFLENLSIALNVYFLPTKVVSAYSLEKQNNWENFLSEDISLIISSDYTIFELPNLRKLYIENPSKQEKFLKNIPLFLLPDISIYFKEPKLKLSLFKAIEQKISYIQALKS